MKKNPRSNSVTLATNIVNQINSLFVGVVINDTSLVEYAYTKKLIGYNGGYTFETLSKMQYNIDTIRSKFPNIYASYRIELLAQIQGRGISSIFTICDKYINNFLNIRVFNHAEVYKNFLSFANRSSL